MSDAYADTRDACRILNHMAESRKEECEKLREELAKYQWISVTDRLPEKGVDVLVYGRVYAERNGIDVDYVDESGNFYYYDEHITHWQSLPEPPKDEE